MSRIKELLTKLHCEYPIVSAPMAGVSGGRLAAAVTISGGFGFIGAGYLSPSKLLAEFQIAEHDLERNRRSLIKINPEQSNNKPFLPLGVGFITWTLERNPEVFNVALKANPLAYWFSFGDYMPYVTRIRAQCPHAIIMVQVDSVADAVQASKDGIDVIIPQGLEAGGHGPKDGTSTFCLVPSVRAALDSQSSKSFLLAAGGISNHRHLAAAFNLGAHGAVIGTLFCVAHESLLPEGGKLKMINAGEKSTVTTGRIDVLRNEPWDLQRYTARALKSQLTTDLNYEIMKEEYKLASEKNDFSVKGVFAGMGVDLVTQQQSAQQIIHEIVKNYSSHMQTRHYETWAPSKL